MVAQIEHDQEMANGHAHPYSNGHVALPDFLGPEGLINRVEYVRLLQQSLRRLGFPSVADMLAEASGIPMQPDSVTHFQHHVMQGRWDTALSLLADLTDDRSVLRQARFLILQQKYLEAIQAGDLSLALQCLRKEVAPLRAKDTDLHSLAGCLLRQPEDAANPLIHDEWRMFEQHTRAHLLQELQARLPPSLMLPEGRLEHLVEQALAAQVSRCPFHNTAQTRLSLFSDYHAGIEQLPTQLAKVLERHADEVWHVQFSHRGDMLASASKDCTAIIWQVHANGDGQVLHMLTGHIKPLSFLAWSPDDAKLLTCGNDHWVKLWDIASGICLYTFTNHQQPVTACAWLPDSRRFLTGSVDKMSFLLDVEGNILRRWKHQRINDMAVSADGSTIISVCQERQIRLCHISDHREATLTETAPITSLAISPAGDYLLANLANHTSHLWPLAPCLAHLDRSPANHGLAAALEVAMPGSPLVEYKVEEGRQGRFVIRTCFGGSLANFVASGSEDCRVYIWHRETGDLLCRLDGHTGTVNSVSWNPTNSSMMASASDDKSIRIWMAKAALPRL
ncbi:hypothetical protein WJX72_002132 [[Myrmecia] bisecta]|uniref:CTLH domain-containing protein n=1 Tax=[Myrmecia] bisecta TaxID=41462 RepID=A0AAW1R552_9CHLO